MIFQVLSPDESKTLLTNKHRKRYNNMVKNVKIFKRKECDKRKQMYKINKL